MDKYDRQSIESMNDGTDGWPNDGVSGVTPLDLPEPPQTHGFAAYPAYVGDPAPNAEEADRLCQCTWEDGDNPHCPYHHPLISACEWLRQQGVFLDAGDL
jgi:hypothetical protein